MKKAKRLLLLALCCLMLCQTTVNVIPTDDEIETCGNHETNKGD